jgi:hypothetical protein
LPEVRAAIDERLEAVESLGFTLAGHFSTGVRPARAATGYVSLWHNARHGDEARLFTAHAHSERPLPDGRVVESTRATTTFLFVTRYADGTKVVTANTCAQGNFARNPHATVLVYPEIGDPAALYRIHRKAVDELGSLSRIQPPRIDDPVAYLAKTSSEEWQRQVDRGEAVVDESDQVFRPTWKGAVLMALRLHWPWRQLRRGSLERRSRRFLRRFPELNEAIR